MDLEFNSPAGTPVVRPGDTLVIGLTDDDLAGVLGCLESDLRERLPGVSFVVIAGVTSLAVYRPDGNGAMETKAADACSAARGDAP